MPEENGTQTESIFVARQPVFNARQEIWGYELLFRDSSNAQNARITDGDMASSQVIADGYWLARTGIPDSRKILINFPRKLIVEGAAHALPKDQCVIEVLEDVEPDAEVIKALAGLKKEGYTIALDDCVSFESAEPFLDVIDLVKVDTLGLKPKKLISLAKKLKAAKVDLLAEKIEDNAFFSLAGEMGFSLFQGFFFSKPEIIPGTKLSSSKFSKLQLLHELSRPDYEVSKLSRIITADVSLSYRLLRYINSAAFGLPAKVKSISQAIAMLGNLNLSQWLRVVVMSDFTSSAKGGELAYMSVLRARFLEILGPMAPAKSFPGDAMFLLGLFSMLDALLGRPMNELLEELPLDEQIKTALLGGESGASVWLGMLNAWDRGDWKEVDLVRQSLGLPARAVAASHATAGQWAESILGSAADKG